MRSQGTRLATAPESNCRPLLRNATAKGWGASLSISPRSCIVDSTSSCGPEAMSTITLTQWVPAFDSSDSACGSLTLPSDNSRASSVNSTLACLPGGKTNALAGALSQETWLSSRPLISTSPTLRTVSTSRRLSVAPTSRTCRLRGCSDTAARAVVSPVVAVAGSCAGSIVLWGPKRLSAAKPRSSIVCTPLDWDGTGRDVTSGADLLAV